MPGIILCRNWIKRACFLFLLPLGWPAAAQPAGFADTAAVYFREIREGAAEAKDFWGMDLYGPLLLVDPASRKVFANFPDTAGILQQEGTVYSGILPRQVNISNTSLTWSGLNWAMLILPLPADYHRRLNILSHELFHRAQKSLGFYPFSPDNPHLDKKDGRISLRLELEALKKALLAPDTGSLKKHLTNALTFRKHRYALFPAADSTESRLEINEGICEYTGLMMSKRNRDQVIANFIARIDQFMRTKSYLRSFAYETIPVYGWLLQQTRPGWHRHVNRDTNLARFFEKAFRLQLPADPGHSAAATSAAYNGMAITAAETEREEKINREIAAFKRKFIEEPHLEIPLEKMNMSFDYTTIQPLGEHGTVYPTIRVTDTWGILDVQQGALISADWKKIVVSMPLKMDGKKISGEGWTLELKEAYQMQKEEAGKNYQVRKLP